MIEYSMDTATTETIMNYLAECDNLFSPRLSSHMNFYDFSYKLKRFAFTAEAYSESKLIGLIACYMNNYENFIGFISHVSVLKPYQKAGVASNLLNMVFDKAAKGKFLRLDLEVALDNKTAMSFYQKHGFDLIVVTKNKQLMSKILPNYLPPPPQI